MELIKRFVACIPLIILSFTLTAQDKTQPSIAKTNDAYERLAETQREYSEIIKTGDSVKVAEISYIMGKRYQSVGDYYNADKWFYRSLRILEPLGPSESLGKVYTYLNTSLLRNNQFDEAILNAKKIILNYKSVGAEERLMGAFIYISGIYDLRKKARENESRIYPKFTLDSASYYRDLANKLGKQIKNLTHAGNITYSVDNTFAHNDTNIVLKSYLKSYDTLLKQGNTHKLLGAAFDLSTFYLFYNNFSKSKEWLQKASSIADTSKVVSYDSKLGLLKLYSELNKKTHNYKEALDYYEKYQELEIKGIKADQDGAISRIKIEYETQKKEIALKQQEGYTKIATLIGIIALAASVILFVFVRKYKTMSRQNAILVEEQNHRVKNNLQEVSNLIILQRFQLNDDKTKTSLNETLQRIEAMAQVQRKLYDSKKLIEIELCTYIPNLTESILHSYSIFNCQPEYKLDDFWLHVDQTIPFGLILNEVITNSCKYAFANMDKDPSLKVECGLDNDMVKLSVTDNGPGFDLNETKGFGLKLLKAFTSRLKGEYNFQYGGRQFNLSFKRKTNLSSKQ